MTDKIYWETYYAMQNRELKPSLFAKFVIEKIISKHSSLIDLGCGNGRDSIYFANNGLNVLGVDQCNEEIQFLNQLHAHVENLNFLLSDFCELDNNKQFDIIYSRFTLHSITKKQEKKVLLWAYQNLNNYGKLCIEVRGQKNEIYGKGEPVEDEKDAFILNDHYRRFINFENFCKQLKEIGFLLEYAEEKKGFAPFKDTDETFIRIIAQK
jgi:tellurite methyltransferase